MNHIVEWCNSNTGFMTALFSFFSLSISVIAIIVSIRTARLPYKRAIKLGSTYNILFSKSGLSVSSKMSGMSVTAINTGARVVNIIFLGLAARDKSFGKELRKIEKFDKDLKGKGRLQVSEVLEIQYEVSDIIEMLSPIPNANVYLFAMDSEGNIYKKHIGIAKTIIEHMNL